MAEETCPELDVVVVMFGPEPNLFRCIDALVSSEGVKIRLFVVDNGCSHPNKAEIAAHHMVELITSPLNLGFSGGVRLGVAAGYNPLIALVNSDVVVERDTLKQLAATALRSDVGVCMPQILRASDGLLNSAGNPLHMLGFSWAGGNGSPALPDGESSAVDIASVSGAMMMLRRTAWDRIGGMPKEFFLYQEDVDLSIACHQAGLRVALVPSAKCHHDYDWARNADKFELVERNRLVVVLTRYPAGLIARLVPPLLFVEIGVLILGGLPGIRRAKLRGYGWILRNLSWIRQRRRANLRTAVHPDGFLAVLTPRFDASAPARSVATATLDRVLPSYLALMGVRTSPVELDRSRVQ